MATRTLSEGRSSGPPAELELPWPEVDPSTHRLREVRFVASPNCDERPDPSDISLLVVHNISLPPGEFGGPSVEMLFTNALDWDAHPYFGTIRDLKVSAHCFIARDGAVTQFVPFDQRAWHAGQSTFEGRSRCNDFSIGIELEGTDDREFTEAQYVQLSRVAAALMRAYPKITRDRIAGHSDIAPGRKTDPGPHFDWDSLRLRLDFVR